MNELDRIREQIKHMKHKGQNPETLWVCYDLWDEMGRKENFAGICVSPSNNILGRFEVR